ncbi:LemA family protein [Mycoplasma sp. Mirounga ES2805-ORL]|uniref:LemA family protein n=1 Tax=Mycoplasma sp. Mirounga ES2805-ORL TaxID=754514 RepID=UPI00197C0CE1|nr:LemA family protein [Mycoplasma sp. Mirounga ES2805-ORL]QSF13548.1 LemA family protein [Mycoplasma sp. Mirounga ES2805-ORL]
MANLIDERDGQTLDQGNDINVINKRIPAKTGGGSIFFEIILWFPLIIPGLIFLFKKINAKKYFQKLEQKIQHNASQIDNYLEQRVMIMQNVVGLVEKSIDLDKDVMKTVAAYRGGVNPNEENRAQVSTAVDNIMRGLAIQIEAYPELKAHKTIADAMQQNSYLQKEITAAREVYNDTVLQWNREIFDWPTKMIVANKQQYTTRIPFATSKTIKEEARQKFF